MQIEIVDLGNGAKCIYGWVKGESFAVIKWRTYELPTHIHHGSQESVFTEHTRKVRTEFGVISLLQEIESVQYQKLVSARMYSKNDIPSECKVS